MAHGFLQPFDPKLEVFSAGTKPAEKVNPLAVKVMRGKGIDISDHTPHDVKEYLNEPWEQVDESQHSLLAVALSSSL